MSKAEAVLNRRFRPSFAEICEFFFDQEARLELVDAAPGGLPLWAAMRVKASQLLAARLGIGQAPHLRPRSTAGLFERVERRSRHWVDYSPFEEKSTCDVVLLEHTRTTEHHGVRLDVYSEDRLEDFRRSGQSYRLLSAAYAPGLDKDFSPPRYSTERILTLGWVEPCTRGAFLDLSFLRSMREFDARAEARFGVRLGAVPLALRRFQALSGRAELYTRLLEQWAPREVYLVEGYGLNVSFVAAARRLGLPVTELQHGTFGAYHLGYAYPERRRPVPGLADRLVVWSEQWKARVPFAREVAEVVVDEPSFLGERRARAAAVPKEKLAVVLSQGMLGDRVAEAFAEVRERFAGYRVVYKLHPGEYARRASYAQLARLEREGAVEVVLDADLATLLARAEVAIGVYSTALYEALDLGCRVALLDLPGVEFSRHLVEEGRAEMLQPSPANG